MDDNVMARYTTEAKEPIHYIQYDQGIHSKLFNLFIYYNLYQCLVCLFIRSSIRYCRTNALPF